MEELLRSYTTIYTSYTLYFLFISKWKHIDEKGEGVLLGIISPDKHQCPHNQSSLEIMVRASVIEMAGKLEVERIKPFFLEKILSPISSSGVR